MLSKSYLLFACLVTHAVADLRFASQPHPGYGIKNERGAIPFVQKNIFHRYMIPSSFGYKKLGPLGRPNGGSPFGRRFPFRLSEEGTEIEDDGALGDIEGEGDEQRPFGRFGRGRSFVFPPRGQKYRNYDNFLRSNIDNEQDNREFTVDPGRDHLPFRTNETGIYRAFRTDKFDERKMRPIGPIDLMLKIKAGDSVMLPFRWNNPHASELEVNIWVFPQKMHPVVIPVKKPTCSGEGHQDNIISFTVPKDFTKLGSKIPNFEGCNEKTKPMCVLQVYAHSVESRMYAYGSPIVIPGHEANLKTTSTDAIKPITPDPGVRDFNKLRDLCLSSADPSQHIPSAIPRWARLVSDLFTHAYMNSNYSPYSGQQHESISKALQASCINKMWAGNRGELGKSILTSAQKSRTGELNKLEGRTYKRYERMANMLIRQIERNGMMRTTGTVEAMGTKQRLATCFRCLEVGSTVRKRLQTNTYIPSFQLPRNLVAPAKRRMNMFRAGNLINHKGQVQIYVAALRDLLPFFHASQKIGILYQTAMLKNTLATYPHPTKHIKKNARGQTDSGQYAAKFAKKDLVEKVYKCPFKCLWCKKAQGTIRGPPLIRGAQATCVTGKCSNCVALFGKGPTAQSPKKPPMTESAKTMAKDGVPPKLPKDVDDGVTPYLDLDGSPDENRPVQPGEEKPELAKSHDWSDELAKNPAAALLLEESSERHGGGEGGRRRRRLEATQEQLIQVAGEQTAARRRRRSGQRAARRQRKSEEAETILRPAWFAEVLEEGEEEEA